jgi:hypothetical protein
MDNMLNFHRKEIKMNSIIIDFLSKYNQRPDLVAWEYYESAALAPLILFANKSTSVFQFNQANIGTTLLIPNKSYLQKLLTSKI